MRVLQPSAAGLALLVILPLCLAATPVPAPESNTTNVTTAAPQAPEPDPTPQTATVSPDGGEIVGAIIWSIFVAILLIAGAFWFHDEDKMSITEQLKVLEQKEHTRRMSRKSVTQVRETADLPSGMQIDTEGEPWMVQPLRYDAKELDESKHYKNWQQYIASEHVQEDLKSKSVSGNALKERFLSLMTKAQHSEFVKWQLCEIDDHEKEFALMTPFEKMEFIGVIVSKFVGIFCVLYLFIIALSLMGNGFKILGGREAGRRFRESELFDNPIAGLVLGVLVTVMLQSSSTTTSIIISMSAGGLIEVRNAAFMIMGANIGTSVTNTIVSVFHLNNPEEYRRAFTGATYHDMFNWCTVAVFLPLEACTGFLVNLAGSAVESLDIASKEKGEKIAILKVITKPAAGRMISIDKKLITKIAAAEDEEAVKELEAGTIVKQKSGHLWRESPIDDASVGWCLVFVSILMLCVMLLLLVKLLQSVLKGQVAIWLRWMLNLDFDNIVCRQLGGLDNYILLIFGMGVTIIFQSSSVFTSAVTPLCGIGLVHVDKLQALTNGANIGTTVTGCLSALAGSNMVVGMQVALVHVFFNCLGTVLWFSVWPLRPIPLAMAKTMGETAYKIRWFPAVYIGGCFFIGPAAILAISIGGWQATAGVLTPVFFFIVATLVILYMRRNVPEKLPDCLRSDEMCGAPIPNFMRVHRDEAKDAVNFAELREKEVLNKEIRRRTKWEYSALCWGLASLGLLAMFAALPSSQWRRVRYGVEPGRHEFGIGYDTVCNKDFGGDVEWMSAPSAACTPAQMKTWLEAENSTLLSKCSEGGGFGDVNDWMPKKYSKESDKYWKKKAWKKDDYKKSQGDAKPYHEAWYIAMDQGCHAAEFMTGCLALAPTPCAGVSHATYCHIANAAWINRHARSMLSYPTTSGKVWTAVTGDAGEGAHCKKISEWCPGPLEDDMSAVGGLAISGTLFLGIGTFFLMLFTGKVSVAFRKCILVSAATLTLAWVLITAAWGHLHALESKEYSCPFLDETHKGAVMVTGKLGDLTMQSYAWAMTIFSWGCLSIVLPFVLAKAHKEITHPFTMPTLQQAMGEGQDSRVMNGAGSGTLGNPIEKPMENDPKWS